MYVIRYEDDCYESALGSGWPCRFEEARRFDSKDEAKDHAENLTHYPKVIEVEEEEINDAN